MVRGVGRGGGRLTGVVCESVGGCVMRGVGHGGGD